MASAEDLERRKFELERSRYLMDVLRWIVVAIGAVASFYVIDLGKLRLERAQATADNQRQLLEAYLKATESAEPEVWKRKLGVLLKFGDEDVLVVGPRDKSAVAFDHFLDRHTLPPFSSHTTFGPLGTLWINFAGTLWETREATASEST